MKIKSKLLMIRDWIKSHTGMNVKVGVNHDYPSEYEPIILTPEILEKNGFKTKEILHQYRWSIFYDDMLILSKINFDYEIQINGFPYKIHYVHELKNILRLCGLDELANNFKN